MGEGERGINCLPCKLKEYSSFSAFFRVMRQSIRVFFSSCDNQTVYFEINSMSRWCRMTLKLSHNFQSAASKRSELFCGIFRTREAFCFYSSVARTSPHPTLTKGAKPCVALDAYFWRSHALLPPTKSHKYPRGSAPVDRVPLDGLLKTIMLCKSLSVQCLLKASFTTTFSVQFWS